MIKQNWIYALLFSLVAISCSDDGDTVSERGVNDFVWKGLNSWYFWQDEVPALSDNAFVSESEYQDFLKGKNPEDLFYSLLYRYQVIDRDSWIVEDVTELLKGFSGITVSSGMDLTLSYLDKNAGTVLGIVNYVIPNSPAEKEGIKRGDLILGVNGQQLNDNNFRALFSESFSVTFGQKPSIKNGEITIEDQINVYINSIEINENPVHYYTVREEGNHKIGYLVYNGFKNVYNDELNEVFGYFKSQGITDLVLDLRYNGGGNLRSAIGLAQMITGQFTNSPFVSLEFNEKHTQDNEMARFSKDLLVYEFINGTSKPVGKESINSLNLNKLYVLTSGGTASASELTISGLRPYVEVVTIGEQTYGKFVGSNTLYDSPKSDFTDFNSRNKNHNYAMQPITFAYFNADHQTFYEGLPADYNFKLGDYIGMRDFGSVSDVAYAKALQLITGKTFRKSEKNQLNFSTEFLGTSKTMQKFGTELYIDPAEM